MQLEERVAGGVGLGRALASEFQVPNHLPAGRMPPGTFSERVSLPRSVYALPCEVPTSCRVYTATMERSPEPTVPVVCSAGFVRSTDAALQPQ
ncbi:hypothetical protein AQJ54_19135 [Streptomyces griseorubiginosus]|uniref:Uncharacterized protein n=1 Tax=Streptomyces griseorubiginosus TaxID=67304 RepID=A0A101S1Z8_9ACTN|nr:hypothetical protein AQJ54_19135 [Streptomyces griseorubiginosus]